MQKLGVFCLVSVLAAGGVELGRRAQMGGEIKVVLENDAGDAELLELIRLEVEEAFLTHGIQCPGTIEIE